MSTADVTRPYGTCSITGPLEDVRFILKQLPDIGDAAPAHKPLTQAEVAQGFGSTGHPVEHVLTFEAGVRYAENKHGVTP